MEKFVIVDGNNLMFRAFYALPQLTNFDGEISNAVFGFTNMLIKIIREYEPKYLAVAFDVSKKTFRTEKFPMYKGTRKPTPIELINQFPIMKDLLRKMNVSVVEKDGLEADDLMGILSRKFETENIIVSADRDTFQLINDNTSVLFPKRGVSETILIDKTNLKDFYGVESSQVIELKSLMGDSSDNIPGVGGVGEKTALDLINKYGSLDEIYVHVDEIKGKLHDKLLNDKEQAYLSKFLATIVVQYDLDCDLNDFTYDFPFDETVKDVFKRYQFGTLLKRDDIYKNNPTLVTVQSDATIVSTIQDLKNIVENIKDKIYLYIDESFVSIYSDKEYRINISTDLLSQGIDFVTIIETLKPVLESDTIGKVLFDSKSYMHYLDKFGVGVKNVAFDCLIARYLINSIAKASITLDEVMVECGLAGEKSSLVIKSLEDIYYAKLEKMNLLSLYNDIELPLIYVLYDMEKAGFKIDCDELKNLDQKYSQEIKELEGLIYDIAGEKFNISSPKQLGEILFDKLDLNIPNNKKKSTSIEVLQEIENRHPLVPLIIRYRLVTKLYSTYIVGFETLKTKEDKIHTLFNQTLTSTGRLSSSEPNLQNIPVRTEEGRALRKIFVPSKKDGFILSADYSQIELRLLAHFSGDERLIDSYNNGKDIHTRTASEIFGLKEEEVTADLRSRAKAINFGIVYGISDFGLSRDIGISRKEASQYIKMYFERYPSISTYMKSNVDFAKENGYVKTLFGRIRPVPEINSNNYTSRQFGERVAMNMPLQGSASDIIKLAMINIHNRLVAEKLQSKIILQVHDELVVDVAPGELEIVKNILKEGMENVVDLKVKLTVNISSGKTWFDAK